MADAGRRILKEFRRGFTMTSDVVL